MISVEAARAALFDLVAPIGTETVALREAHGRVLRQEVAATHNQPPFDASAMDGYALKSVELEQDAQFKVVGEAAAGHGWSGTLKPGQAVRIFTGAPVPDGADTVVIQENVARSGDLITIREAARAGHIRPAGGDFRIGTALPCPRRLTASEVALLAAMNIPQVAVSKTPDVALISTGDELVMPGEALGPDQIVVSNTFGLAAMLETAGARARLLPIARDTEASLRQVFDLARGADLIVTIGGASVGDHDLVGKVAQDLGMERSFYKVAMRPGKPLMAGQIGDTPLVGLPGNPVSAMVCGHVFLLPMIRKMLGLGAEAPRTASGILSADIEANGPREHYMRARLGDDGITTFGRQDSSLLHVLVDANVLLIRPPHDPARKAGDAVRYIAL